MSKPQTTPEQQYQPNPLQIHANQLLTAHRGTQAITRLVIRSLESQEPILSDDDMVSMMDALGVIADKTAETTARIEEIVLKKLAQQGLSDPA